MRMRRTSIARLTVPAVAALLQGAALLASCAMPFSAGVSLSYSSNGERIYFSATGSSNRPITSSGGIMMMRQLACANCHGPEGRGGRVGLMMLGTLDVPDITWGNLTGQDDHDEAEDAEGHGEHPPYTEETLKRAVTRGINPAGEPLDDVMPRWRMSEADLDDLVDFIKTLR